MSEKKLELRKVQLGVFSKLALGFGILFIVFSGLSVIYLLRHFFDDKSKYILYTLHQGAGFKCASIRPDSDAPLESALEQSVADVDFATPLVISRNRGEIAISAIRKTTDLPGDLLLGLTGHLAKEFANPKINGITKRIEILNYRSAVFLSACRLQAGASSIQEVGSERWLGLIVSEEDALKPAYAAVQRIGFMILAFLFLGVIGVLLLARTFTNPLKLLGEVAEDLGAGKYHFTHKIGNRDELGVLYDHFQILASKLENREQELAKSTDSANRDFLTLLWNRRYMERRSSELFTLAQRHDRDFSLIFIDVDHFKQVNDNLGHQAGDDILRELSDLFKEEMRRTDFIARLDENFAARMGGEEFLLVLPETPLSGALVAATKMMKLIRDHEFLREKKYKITVSMGVASRKTEATVKTIAELINQADALAYKSKNAGRNCIHTNEGKFF